VSNAKFAQGSSGQLYWRIVDKEGDVYVVISVLDSHGGYSLKGFLKIL